MEETLHDHEKRISELEKTSIRTEERHNNLMEKLDNLTGILKWVGITSAGQWVVFLYL